MDLCRDIIAGKNRGDDAAIITDLPEQYGKVTVTVFPCPIKPVDLPGNEFDLALDANRIEKCDRIRGSGSPALVFARKRGGI